MAQGSLIGTLSRSLSYLIAELGESEANCRIAIRTMVHLGTSLGKEFESCLVFFEVERSDLKWRSVHGSRNQLKIVITCTTRKSLGRGCVGQATKL